MGDTNSRIKNIHLQVSENGFRKVTAEYERYKCSFLLFLELTEILWKIIVNTYLILPITLKVTEKLKLVGKIHEILWLDNIK